MSRARSIAPKETEAQWLRQVRDLALMFGWKLYHARYSLGADPGWPDIFAVRGTRAVAAELKGPRGKYTEAQAEWLVALKAVEGIDTYLWRPEDIDEVTRVLGR